MPSIEEVLAQKRAENSQQAETPQDVAQQDAGQEDGRLFFERAWDDVKDTVSNWATGAVQGINEVARAQRQQTEGLSNGGSYDEGKQNNDYVTKAQKDFVQQTAEPVIMPAALAVPGLGPVAGAMLAGDVYSGVKDKGAAQTARDFTYGQAADFANQPDLGQQLHNRPVSTVASGAMSVLPLALIGRGLYDRITRIPKVDENGVPVAEEKPPVDNAANMDTSLNNYRAEQEPAPAAATSSDSGFEAFVNAVSGQESGGNYEALNDRTGAAGKFQIMPENWEPWSREAGLPEGSEMTPENQEIVARHMLKQLYDNYGPRGAAEAWYGGEGAVKWSDEAKSRPQGNGDEPSVNEYADQVLARMGDYKDNGAKPAFATAEDSGEISRNERQLAEDKANADSADSDLANMLKHYDKLDDTEKLFVDYLEHDKIDINDVEAQIKAAQQKAIDDYSEILWGQIKQPGLSVPKENASGDVFTRTYSQNYKWFNDLAAESGYSANKLPKKVLKQAIPEIAEEHLRNGYNDPMYGPQVSEAMMEQFNGWEAAKNGIGKLREKVKSASAESNRDIREAKAEDGEQRFATGRQQINNKTWYHGTGTPDLTIDKLSTNATKIEGLYGHGVYLTDNPDIAQGYANSRGKRTGTPTVYKVNVNVGNVLNLEKPMPYDAYNIFRKSAEDIANRWDDPEILQNIEELHKNGANGDEIYRAYSKGIENISNDQRIPKSEFVEDFQDLSANLKNAGYDAYTHVGGKIKGKNPHQVLVMLDHNDELSQAGRKNQITRFDTIPNSDLELAKVMKESPELKSAIEYMRSVYGNKDIKQTKAEGTADWSPDFPKIKVITNTKSLKNHPQYDVAKNKGDWQAAVNVIEDLTNSKSGANKNARQIEELAKKHPDAILVPAIAEEANADNRLPQAFAYAISGRTGLVVNDSIRQVNKTGHTGATALTRLLNRAKFEGEVEPGKKYILVDDVATQGGTLNELRKYIESKGGKVVDIQTLAAERDSTQIAIRASTKSELEGKFGKDEITRIIQSAGIGRSIGELTEGEAKYLLKFKDVDSIRAKGIGSENSDSTSRAQEILRDEVVNTSPDNSGIEGTNVEGTNVEGTNKDNIEYSRTSPPNQGGISLPKEQQGKTSQQAVEPSNFVSRFAQQDVIPAAKSFAQALVESAKGLRNALSPASAGKNAKATAEVMRENLAEMAQKADRMVESLSDARDHFSSLSPEQNLDIINRIETGQKQATPELQQFADELRKQLDTRRQEIQDLGTGKLQKYIENYFPHVWKDPKQAESFIGQWFHAKRPFEGSKSFLKSRSLPTTADGIEAGLEPISYNPVDLVIMKAREMDKYIMAHKTLNELKEMGLVKFVKATSSDIPEGWTQLDDKVGTVYAPPEVTIKEAFDPAIMDALNNTMKQLGVDHTRLAKVPLGKDSAGVWGFTDPHSGEVVTKFGGPESVVAHELGHQLAYKYNLDDLFRNDPTKIKTSNGKYTTAGEEMSRELEILADKRLPPDSMDEGQKAYVQQHTEPIAAVVEAYIHAPEVLKEYAPTVYKNFTKFLDEHPELHELRDAKPSLLLGENSTKQAVPGLIVSGHYYLPDEAARLINNYISPGLRDKSSIFRAYLGVANVMNQFQLGMSAFHLGFTSMDSIVSKVALSAIKISRGDFSSAAKDLAHTPIAPVENAMRGDKLYKEWMKPGSTDAQTAQLVDALKAGGGRVKMDDLYRTNIYQTMKDAWKQGNFLGAAGRVPFAVMEQSVKPILEYVVPRQKLGVFADLMRYEMERNPNMTRDQLRYTSGKIWNSVDNRLGQLAYDNLFWNKILKDLSMASVRSVGWNLGTFRELGGAAVDTVQQGANLVRGKKAEMTYKMSYAIALPITVGLFGSIIQYMYTGEGPENIKDLFFPRTGTLDAHGRPQRIELPSYMKDLYAYHEHPGTTLINKLHPMISTVADMLKNKDYYGTRIYNEDDNYLQKASDLAKFAGKNMTPFSLQGSKYQSDLGSPLLSRALPFVGVTPAPSSVNKTDVEKTMSDMLAARRPMGSRTKEQAEHSDLKSSILRDMQMNGGAATQSLRDAVDNKGITRKEAKEITTEAKLTPLQRNAQKLDAEDIQALINQAEPQEKEVLAKIYDKKMKEKQKQMR